jgi:hypothetical protein
MVVTDLFQSQKSAAAQILMVSGAARQTSQEFVEVDAKIDFVVQSL